MSRQRHWLWPVLCLAVLCTACDIKVGEDGLSVDFAVGRATDEWTRTYEIQPGGRLEIVNTNGAIHVTPSDGPQIEVHATREVRAGSEEAAREILATSEMIERVEPDSVSIHTPNEGESGRRRSQLRVEYRVRVPAGLTLDMRTQNGEVRLENIDGRITASTTNGGVNGSGLSGSMAASTVNGGIRIELESVTADSRLVTVNGGILLTVADDLDADLEATVVNGGVSIQDGLPFSSQEQSRQRVAGRLNAGGPRIVAQTTNGGVRVGSRQ